MALSKYVDVLKQRSEPAVSWAADHPRLALGLAASGLAAVYFLQGRLREPRLPPGPRRWPIVGSLPSLSDKFYEDIMRLKEIHGDIFTIWMGSKPLVVLASYDAIREVFFTRGSDFAGRPDSAVIGSETMKDEIFTAPYDEAWAKNKKYALTSLRTLGGIKAATDGAIVEVTAALINQLRATGKKPIDVKDVLLLTTTNIMSRVMFSEHYDYDDPKLVEFKDSVMRMYECLNEVILDTMLPVWMAKMLSLGKLRKLKGILTELQVHVAKRVEEHRKTLDPANPRDLVDMYLIKPGKEIGVGFYDTLIILLPDSIDSIATFMRWIVLYLGHHPDVQKKVQAEIGKVVGPSQMVNISHRSQLKYIDAVILEVIRCSDVAVDTTTHCATKSGLTFRGYDFTPSVSIIGSIQSVHKDPKLFPDPEKFDPQRFLNENGDLVNTNYIIPFSIGRRMCLGENLARLELCIFTANVMHTFNIRFPDGEEKPSLKPAGGFIQYPEPFKVIFDPRD